MNSLAPLMRLIDAYGAVAGLADKTISHRVFRDTKKITALREGGDITTTRLDDAFVWFAAHWPDGAEWPADVPRPVVPAPNSEAAA